MDSTKTLILESGTEITLRGGCARVLLDADIPAISTVDPVSCRPGNSTKLSVSAQVQIVAGPELIAGTDGAGFQLKDDKIALGATAIQLIGGGGVMSIDPSGVTMAGAMIKSEATGDNEVAAPIVVII